MSADKINDPNIAYFLFLDKVLEFINFNFAKNNATIGNWKTSPTKIITEKINETYSLTKIKRGIPLFDGKKVDKNSILNGNNISYDKKIPTINSRTLKKTVNDRKKNFFLLIAGKINLSILYKIKGKDRKKPE